MTGRYLMTLAVLGAVVPLAASGSAMAVQVDDGGFCARLKVQTEAARAGFKSIRGEFRAGRTGAGLLVMRTYSNVELWPDTACYFSVENGDILHSCETGFDKDDASARVLRDNLAVDLKTCFGREIKGQPVFSDSAIHTATLPLTANRAVLLTVNAQEKDGTDGRILISVRVHE